MCLHVCALACLRASALACLVPACLMPACMPARLFASLPFCLHAVLHAGVGVCACAFVYRARLCSSSLCTMCRHMHTRRNVGAWWVHRVAFVYGQDKARGPGVSASSFTPIPAPPKGHGIEEENTARMMSFCTSPKWDPWGVHPPTE